MKTLRWSILAALLAQASAALGAPFAYVVNLSSQTLSVLDTATNTVTATVPMALGFGPVAVDFSGTRLYAVALGRLLVLDTASNTITDSVPLASLGIVNETSQTMAISPDGTRVYLGNSGSLTVVDTATYAMVATLRPRPGVRVAASNAGVYVLSGTSRDEGVVQALDIECNTLSEGIALPQPFPRDIAVNPEGSRVYVTSAVSFTAGVPGNVSVIDTASNSVIATVPVGILPFAMAVNPAGTRVYVANGRESEFSSTGSVSVIDAASNTVIATIPMASPYHMAVDPTGTRLYVLNGNNVSVIDTATNSVIATVAVGINPLGIAIPSGIVPPPPPDDEPEPVHITGVEVTQGIQDLANNVPLISGRKTFVRVHAQSDGPAVPGVTATLNGAATTCNRGSCFTNYLGSLAPVNSVGPRITVRPDPKRSVLDDSFLFELPSNWTAGRSVQLHAAVTAAAGPPPPPTCLNDVLSAPLYGLEYPRFLKIQFVRLSYSIGGTIAQASIAEQQQSESFIRRTYPLSSLAATPDFPLFDAGLGSRVDQTAKECQDIAVASRNTCAQRYITSRLASLQAISGFLGLMRQRAQGSHELIGWPGDADGAYALIPQHPAGRFTRGACCDNRIAAGPSNDADYAAHEIGHLLGRSHPVNGATFCGHDAVDEEYPHVLSLIASSPELAGFDGGDAGLAIPQSFQSHNSYDYMGYCDPWWTSDYTYNAISLCLREVGQGGGARCGQAGGAGADGADVIPGDWLTVFGNISSDPATANFVQTQRVDRIVSVPSRTPGDHSIRLIGEGGVALADYPFVPTAVAEGETGAGAAPLSFGHVVPFVAGTQEIQIVDSAAGMVIGAKTISPNRPLISDVALEGDPDPDTVAVTLEWTASDPDGDLLTFDVFLDRDGGASFLEPLALGVSGASAEIDTTGLAGGIAQFRVVATDGVQSASADSAPFTLADKPPRPQILTPGDGAVVYAGQLVALEGKANDPKDGIVSEPGLAWSTPAGPLGSGSRLSVTDLPVGTHLITLTATNSLGLAATTSASVSVNEVVDQPGPTLTAGPTQIGWHVAVGEVQLQTAELEVGNSGSGDLEVTARSSAPWLALSAATATAPATLTLTADPSGIGEGVTREATVTLSAVGIPGQGITIPVTLSAGNTFVVPIQECVNGIDDDADGTTDLGDPGCDDASDVTEHSLALPCDDGLDNDGDGRIDFDPAGSGDLGCASLVWPTESPQCQDGVDNDGQPGLDFDGGASLDRDGDGFVDAEFNPATPAVGARDPQCRTTFKDREAIVAGMCGIGPELAPLLLLLLAARRRQRAN